MGNVGDKNEECQEKNCSQLVCLRCNCKILPPNMGTFMEFEFELVSMKKENEGEKERVTKFYRVDDMFHFDNIGFSNTVGNYKFLSCADCDLAPIGYHDISTRLSYIAIDRIKII